MWAEACRNTVQILNYCFYVFAVGNSMSTESSPIMRVCSNKVFEIILKQETRMFKRTCIAFYWKNTSNNF